LEYQRHIHLQRLAEQEAEMQARLDQQRRYAQQREQQNHVDYRINQVIKTNIFFPSEKNFIIHKIPYVQPPSTVGYYQHPIHPSQLTSHSFSMGREYI